MSLSRVRVSEQVSNDQRADTFGRSAEGEDKIKQFETSWRKIHVTCVSFPELCNPVNPETTVWESGVGIVACDDASGEGSCGCGEQR